MTACNIEALPAGGQVERTALDGDQITEIRCAIEAIRGALEGATGSSVYESQSIACSALTDLCLIAPSTERNINMIYRSRMSALAYFDSLILRSPMDGLKLIALIEVNLMEATLLARTSVAQPIFRSQTNAGR